MKVKLSNFFALAALGLGLVACGVETEYLYSDYDADSNALLDDNEFGSAWDDTGYYDRWDTDTDGYLTEDEWYTGYDSYWAEDGLIGREDYADWDGDGDGRIAENEFRQGIWTTYDRDEDGYWSDAEYDEWWNPFDGV